MLHPTFPLILISALKTKPSILGSALAADAQPGKIIQRFTKTNDYSSKIPPQKCNSLNSGGVLISGVLKKPGQPPSHPLLSSLIQKGGFGSDKMINSLGTDFLKDCKQCNNDFSSSSRESLTQA